ncbi:MAG: mannosyltransferase family protein [Chloroflexota bacterium]
MEKTQHNEWRTAAVWGLKIALAHRIILLVWMAIIWVAIGQAQHIPIELQVDPIAKLPDLSASEQATLGVWRRWDASHYLNLAQNGYRGGDPGPTVFGVLTPIGIHVFDAALPGGVDIAGMAFATVAFWLALVLLYRVCEVYYGDSHLGRWATVMLALSPLSFFFSAPMSEAIYLAMVLGIFYAGARDKWGWAAVCGVLATLARSQGILLAGIGGIMLWEQSSGSLRQRGIDTIKKGWPLAVIPLALVAFLAFRQSQGLPALDEIYRTRSFIFFVNPIEGLRLNIAWAFSHPGDAIFNPDLWALVISVGLAIWMLFSPRHRRIALVAYTFGSILIFVSKVNWVWGDTSQVTYTQSFARYSLALFPLTVVAADKLRTAPRPVRAIVIGTSVLGLLIFSALFTLGGGAP